MWYITQWNVTGHEQNEIMSLAATWMDLEIINLSEVSQKEKDKYHMIYHYAGTLKYDTTFSTKQTHRYGRVLNMGWGVGNMVRCAVCSLLFTHQVLTDSLVTPQSVTHQDPLSMGFPR